MSSLYEITDTNYEQGGLNDGGHTKTIESFSGFDCGCSSFNCGLSNRVDERSK
jgi:hypothetical protein